ncbi:MAG: PD-(D/E)XK nuclease family protein, partial [Alphaproteobacteria bacterium]|nr:PD-(D/E)XK nuclease family protein [Alphaproteobacteria bacterium]
PCWRPLLDAIAAQTSVRWNAGPRTVPDWLDRNSLEVELADPQTPDITTLSAATAYHEAIEATRWARRLVATGKARPEEIAIASVNTSDYDDFLLALRSDANIDIHFAHGIKVTTKREGQAASALADILVRGLSQNRVRRLAALLAAYEGPIADLPSGWTSILPPDAPLSSLEAWSRLFDRLTASDWPDGIDHGPALSRIVESLSEGTAAAETGEFLLSGPVLNIWRKALQAGSAASIDLVLETLRTDDGLDACVSITWMPASALAASPRPYARLLGLNSSRWPRAIAEDRLLSDHIIPTRELDPLPVNLADRRDFATIAATTARKLVLSRARRDSDGRLLGRSVLLEGMPEETYLRRNRIPEHAFSETDRLTARRDDFQALPQAVAAAACWQDWYREGITPHDGLVRPGHPAIQAILERTQSASSLRQLLRNPIGFVWQYGLRWRSPESGDDPLVLDALATGKLVHEILEGALGILEADGGLARAGAEEIAAAVDGAVRDVAARWESTRAVPPRIVWRRTLDEARELGTRALCFRDGQIPGGRAYGEVPFGGTEPSSDAALPWNAATAVEIPDTGFRIRGSIDRLDVSPGGQSALVQDYKTGRTPKNEFELDGGRELQRCCYAYAARAMLGGEVQVEASLLYLRDIEDRRLEDPDATLDQLGHFLRAARANLADGGCTIGADTGGQYDDLLFALPANAGPVYCERKAEAAGELLGAATEVWEAP